MRRLIILSLLAGFGCGGAEKSDPAPAPEMAPATPEEIAVQYAGAVYTCVMSAFKAPQGAAADAKATVWVRVEADGSLKTPVLETSSGDPVFDMAVSAAVQDCKGLAPPPEAIADKLASEGYKMVLKP